MAVDSMLDRRLNAFRPDLADERLLGQVEAARFVTGEPAQVVAPVLPLHREPSAASPRETEALYGEAVRVLERAGGWAWVQLASDAYVGYVDAIGLAAVVREPTHRVLAPATFLYERPDIKSPARLRLPMNSLLQVAQQGAQLSRLAEGGWVVSRHLVPCAVVEPDYVAVAERCLDVPYLWGGRSSLGLDCSGLVQLAMSVAGLACPRDTDMQLREIAGEDIPVDTDAQDLRRGDLLFWTGHVAIVTAPGRMLHANAHHMAVAAEPVAPALERIAAAGSRLAAVRRVAAAGVRPRRV